MQDAIGICKVHIDTNKPIGFFLFRQANGTKGLQLANMHDATVIGKVHIDIKKPIGLLISTSALYDRGVFGESE